MAELASDDEHLEPSARQLLAQIYAIVSRIESRLEDMEERQKTVGSFASTDQ